MNVAIIVAAGSGSRFAADKPKQFTELLGKPLIIHTLEQFEACPAVDEIVLVLSEDGRREFKIQNAKFKISKLKRIVTGGATRAESVRNGMDSIAAADNAIVAVHDGARPLVTPEEIAAVIVAAAETGAACLVAPVNDTIKSVEGGVINFTVDRSRLRRALTPQAFRYDILKRAFEDGEVSDAVTDECYLVEKLGVPITMVEGSATNIKITRPEDLIFAEAILSVART
ncbi:MAG: 2-C-methyl-D-erythritol 4-phosphate cytidylyltransferase [Pyrinomonadaceae bacterium]|nr:2-C-methyl-D-erythritol 4-phosphate cytidylyltransferase [Pyrinomonadaceae bacterium]